MTGLAVAALASGVWAIFASSVVLSIHLALDVVALAYAVLMYRSGRRRSERLRKVRSISRHPLAGRTASWPAAGATVTLDDEPLFVDEPIAL